MLLGILLAFLILICIALGGVVLLQRSEGGALGMGGGPSGFLTTRGAGDLLTRTTWILGGLLFALCLSLTILQGRLHKGSSVVDRLKIDPLSADALSTPRTPPAPAASPSTPSNTLTGFEAPAAQVNTAPAAAAPPAATSSPVARKVTAQAPARPQKARPTPDGDPPPTPAPLTIPSVPPPAAASNGTGG